MSVYLAEFVGTMFLLILGDGVVANVVLRKTKGEDAGTLMITTGWGLAVALSIYCVGRISGAHINPAVTIGLWAIGEFEWTQVPGYLAAQMAGAFAGAVVVWAAYYSHWDATEDRDSKLGVFCTGPAIRATVPNFICEAVGTAVLVFGVLAIGANAAELGASGEIDLTVAFSTGFAPLLVGLLVWAIGMSLGGPTGYAINPARDLGPRIAHAILPIPGKRDADWAYAWIPVAGPIAGGVLGAFAFKFLGL